VALLVAPVRAESKRGIDVGDSIPARELETRAGEKLAVPAEEGLMVLVFWATWSPRSESTLAFWEKLREEYSEQNVVVVAVNADHQEMTSADLAKVDNFVQEKSIGLPVHVDQNLEFYNEIGIVVVPTSIFVNSDGVMTYRYTGFPTSAAIDLRQDLEKELGIAEEPEAEDAVAAEPAYAPRNNALLYYSLGRRLHEKGFADKAQGKYVIALQKDPDYADPLRALESIYFADGRTPEAEESLKTFLTGNELEGQIDKIGQGEVEAPMEEEVKPDTAGTAAEPATGEKKELSPMERMKLLMGDSPDDSEKSGE
jgi:tetratricopeptide (TPR) repeat protein